MDAARRLELGQWFTPPEVADFALALALPRERGNPRVLDPACGDGVFLARARAAGVAGQGLYGIELDGASARAARERVPDARVYTGDLFDVDSATLGPRFDAVVGNPPYVRQERLTKAQKDRIRHCLARDWPEVSGADIDKLVRRGDLAAACVLRALHLARPGARVALIVSSALLDAGYASVLWRVVASAGRVVALIDAPEERWFADAAVNPMILVMERSGDGQQSSLEPVRAARLSVSTSRAARALFAGARLEEIAEIRSAPAENSERWAACLRASKAWFDFEQAAGDALIPLSQVARVRRGLTSGANDVFYLERERARALDIEPEVLVPLLRSPRQGWHIAIEPGELSHQVLLCPRDTEALAKYPNARRYLEAQSECAKRPTLRARTPWWYLPAHPARLFLTKAYGERFVQRLARVPVIADQRVYGLHPRPEVDVTVLAAIVNTTFTALALESLGRSSMGEGALEWTVADAGRLPILDPRRFAPGAREALVAAFDTMANRPIGAIASEGDKVDRLALDRAAAAVAPPLADLLAAIWPALIDAAHRRNTRRQRFL